MSLLTDFLVSRGYEKVQYTELFPSGHTETAYQKGKIIRVVVTEHDDTFVQVVIANGANFAVQYGINKAMSNPVVLEPLLKELEDNLLPKLSKLPKNAN